MPDDFQPGPHLSPDQLSAFAENTLPAHERLSALAHMADCADCRRVVFLIQQADPALAAAPVAETPRRSWFTLPQIFGAATAALACSLILALIIHHHHQEPQPITTAGLEVHLPAPSPTPPPATTSSSTLTAKPPSSKPAKISPATTHILLPKLAEIVPPKKPGIPQPGLIGRSVIVGSNYAESKALDTGTAAQPPHPSLAAAAPLPAPAAPTESRALRAYAAGNLQKDSSPASTSAAVSLPPPQPPAPAPPLLAPPTARMDSSNTIVAGSGLSISPATTAELNGASTTAALKLPSKLPVATVLNSAGRTLALDTAGSVFLSLDRGKHWTAVTPLWPDKVVHISLAVAAPRLYQVQPSQQQAPSTGAAQQQQATVPTATFQLTTAAGVVWLSTDGLTWHAR